MVLSEFGGYSALIPGHAYCEKPFGYKKFKSPAEMEQALRLLYDGEIRPAVRQGLSAAVYTQLTDVEDEQNGLITYDRAVIKISPEKMKTLSALKIP